MSKLFDFYSELIVSTKYQFPQLSLIDLRSCNGLDSFLGCYVERSMIFVGIKFFVSVEKKKSISVQVVREYFSYFIEFLELLLFDFEHFRFIKLFLLFLTFLFDFRQVFIVLLCQCIHLFLGYLICQKYTIPLIQI